MASRLLQQHLLSAGSSLLPQAAGGLLSTGALPSWFATRAPASSSTATKAKPAAVGKGAAAKGKAGTAAAAPKGKPAASAAAPKKPAAAAAKKPAPPKIKRALSAYTCFVQATSSQWFKPGMAAPDGLRSAGAAWKGMSDAEKAKYVALALESKAASTAARAKAKSERAPPGAYIQFATSELRRLKAERPAAAATALMSEVAARWRALPEADKAARAAAATKARAQWAASRPAA
ncbi:hypothetical protein Rsub_06270 [Raphidocelis subcapitata]|uniref:HMG box domain-containing protein n=1 Tax=Raphidocelis subcapitata TaxID=307507 RepID=A0A2V0P6S5_9CHLO|nr:hypothetical protein Rsub_06270 [Raphidocelis subcapitata]|eukprot:GBF93550.1 hypothetical protein Rsub_06270 [Raphidocelis subcapitata]